MAPEDRRPIRVLVCDDHRMLAEGLSALLDADDDMEVVGHCGTVEDVVADTVRFLPDVIVLDYDLPDGTGLDALGRLRDVPSDAKVVMLTAFADDPILAQAIQAGCAGFLTKRKATADLVEAVRLVAAGEAVIPPDMLARLLPRLARGGSGPSQPLTPREQQVLELLATATTSAEMSTVLGVSPNTVRNHVQAVLMKLGAHSRLEAVYLAARQGLIRRGPTA